MNRSYSKIRHIQEANKRLENRLLTEKRLMEYDIDDEAMASSLEQELASISPVIKEYLPNVDLSSAESAVQSLNGSEICAIGNDVTSFVNTKFGKKVMEMFPDDNPLEIIKQMGISINNFINYLSTLKLSDLKDIFKNIKSKIEEAKKLTSSTTTTTVSEGRLLKEFFGTSMTIVKIGSFEMPALYMSLMSYIIVGFLALWLLKELLCAFNIKITKIKGCSFKSFEWGQCE